MYYPLLRWKQGEQQALKNLFPDVKSKVTPIIEFPFLGEARPNTSKKETMADAIIRQNKSFHKKIKDFPKKLIETWGIQEIFLDLNSLLNQENISINVTDLDSLFSPSCKITPIINLNDSSNDLINYLKKLFSEKTVSALALRITPDTDPENNILIDKILSQLPINISDCSIIYDLKNVSNTSIIQCERSFKSLYNDFNRNFKTTIILSGALTIPSDFEKNNSDTFSRTDWLTWAKIRSISKFNYLQFGDYTISSANFIDVPFRGAPKIKYTLTNKWLVYKGILGRSADTKNSIQYQKMSKDLIKTINLKSPSCYGEDQILKCATGKIEIGSPTSWVAIGVNQHITFVVSQLNAIHLVP